MNRSSFARFKQIKTIPELIDFLNAGPLSWLAFIMLGLWIISPLLVLMYRTTYEVGDQFTDMLNQARSQVFWKTILTQTGLIGMGVGLILWLKSLRTRRELKQSVKQYYIDHAPVIYMALLLFWSVLAWLFSSDLAFCFSGSVYRQEGLRAYLMYAGIFALGLALDRGRQIRWLLDLLACSAAVLALLTVINAPALNDFFRIELKTSVFFNSNHYGYFLCISLAASAVLLLTESRKGLRYTLRSLIMVVVTAALSLNGSLGPLLAAVVGLGVLALLLYAGHLPERCRVWHAIGIFALVTMIVNLSTHYLLLDLSKLYGDVGDILLGSDTAGLAGSARWQLWVGGIGFIGERPFFGFGPDNLGNAYARLGIAIDRPHNELIQVTASLGVPALLFYLSSLAAILHRLLLKLKSWTMMTVGLFCIAVTYFVSGLFGNTMIYTTPYYLIVLAMLVRAIGTERQ